MEKPNKKSEIASKDIQRLKRYSLLFYFIWIILVSISLFWNIYSVVSYVKQLAKSNARSYLKTELTFRSWVSNHGGLYAPLSENTPCNPFLASIQNRETTLPTGDTLTLLSPAYSVKQINHKLIDSTQIFSHLTGLSSINPENKPDEWESNALKELINGEKEVYEFINVNKKDFLRLMQPLKTEQSCLKCHNSQDFKLNDIIGGISISVPMQSLWAKNFNNYIRNISLHISFLLVGFIAINTVKKRFEKRIITSEKNAKIIFESEQKYRLLSSQKGQIVYAYDIESGKIDWEGDLIETIGFTTEEFQTFDIEIWEQMIHPEEQKFIIDELNKALLNCSDFNLEYRFQRKNKTYCYIEDSGTFLKDENNKPIKMFGLMHDVTDKKIALLNLEESEKNYRSLAENSIDFIWKIDLDFRFIYVSPEIFRITGYTVEEMEEINAKQFFLPNEFERIMNIVNEAISLGKDGPGITLESEYIRKEGYLIPVEISGKIIWDAEGNPLGITGYTKNISDRKSAEQALKESELRFRMTFDQAFDPIFIAEIKEGEVPKIVDINKAVTTKLGHTKEDTIGKQMNLFHPSEQREVINKRINKILSGEPLNFESVYQKKDGSLITVEIYAKRIEINGKYYIYIIQRDISDRKQWESEIFKVQKNLEEEVASKNKFFSIISHDLKSPFGTLMSILQLLEESFESLTKKEQKELIHVGRNSSKQIFQLLESLLEWSRLTIGRMEFSPGNINLGEISTQIILLLSQSAKNKSIQFVNEIDGNYSVYADSKMLRAVLINLLTNAIKFSSKGGKITLSSKIIDNLVEISILDTGIGMSQNDLSKLFRIDVHHTTVGTANETGTGLGLILCKELVEKNGGTIWAESELGKGSNFKFTLPLKA